MSRDLHPQRYDREELELLEQRALRTWRDSTWLADHRPRAWMLVENFPDDEVWIDLGGGIGESQQEPGAIVLGRVTEQAKGLEAITGERRVCDVSWAGPEIPADTGTVDRVIIPEGGLRRFQSGEIQMLLKETARVLRPGALLVIREDVAALAKLKRDLVELGFEAEQRSTRRLDKDGEITYRLLQKTERESDRGEPMIRETVLGDPHPQHVRDLR